MSLGVSSEGSDKTASDIIIRPYSESKRAHRRYQHPCHDLQRVVDTHTVEVDPDNTQTEEGYPGCTDYPYWRQAAQPQPQPQPPRWTGCWSYRGSCSTH